MLKKLEDGKYLTSDESFCSVNYPTEVIKTLVLNKNVKHFGKYSYDYRSLYAENLKHIEFNDDLEIIGRDAFKGCIGLTTLNFNCELREIGYHAFYGCVNLTELNFKSIPEIYIEAFLGCSDIKKITFDINNKKYGFIIDENYTFEDFDCDYEHIIGVSYYNANEKVYAYLNNDYTYSKKIIIENSSKYINDDNGELVFPSDCYKIIAKIDEYDNCSVFNLLNCKYLFAKCKTKILNKIMLPNFKSDTNIEIIFDEKVRVSAIEILLDDKIDELVGDKHFRIFIPKGYLLTRIEKVENDSYKIELCCTKDNNRIFNLVINNNKEIICSDDLVDINIFRDSNDISSQIIKLCNKLNIDFNNLDDIRQLFELINCLPKENINYVVNNIDNVKKKQLAKKFISNNYY